MEFKSTLIEDYNAVAIPGFYTFRSINQYILSWHAAIFKPKCNSEFIERIHERIEMGGRVTSTCQCGACKLIAEDAPRIISVCHCSICRFDEARAIGEDDAPAPFFAAVNRSSCRLEINQKSVEDRKDFEEVLVFRNSSDFARRGMCKYCQTYLVMDYEWFEPNTVWLTNPVWQRPLQKVEGLKVEFAFNNGKADFDVCWPSRNDPCTSLTCKVSYLDKGAGEKRDVEKDKHDDIAPRGVLQFKDLDWNHYQIDVGTL